MMAAFLGILKAGKIYVAIDPTEPGARSSRILEDAQANLIITDNKSLTSARQLAHSTDQVLNIDQIVSDVSDDNLGLSIAPEALACILYMSGSTGQPKGVIQNHRNVLQRANRYNSFRISHDDRLTLLSSCSTAIAMADIYSAPLNGASLYPFHIKEGGFSRLAAWLRDLKLMETLYTYLTEQQTIKKSGVHQTVPGRRDACATYSAT